MQPPLIRMGWIETVGQISSWEWDGIVKKVYDQKFGWGWTSVGKAWYSKMNVLYGWPADLSTEDFVHLIFPLKENLQRILFFSILCNLGLLAQY